MSNTSKLPIRKVSINKGIMSWSDYGRDMVSMARHAYEAHETVAKLLGFKCGAEMDDYLRRSTEQ
mgnify:FL=1